MFTVETVWESVKRHIIPIAIVLVLALGLGVLSGMKGGKSSAVEREFVAETVLYVQDYGYGLQDHQSGDFNYVLGEDYIMNDARLSVLNESVSGTVRKTYGEDVRITTPRAVDPKTNVDQYDRFLYIDAASKDADTSLKAAEMAASLTVAYLTEHLPVYAVTIVEEPFLCASASEPTNWGTADFVSADQKVVEVISSGISAKKLVIFGFAGLVISIVAFACYDILGRRVRSPRDIERLAEIAVLEELKPDASCKRLAGSARSLMLQNDLQNICIAGATRADGAHAIASSLSREGLQITAAVNLAEDDSAQQVLVSSDAALLVFKEAASKGSQIEESLKQLKISGVPILGAVFISKK